MISLEPSQGIFGAVGIIALIFGILYIVWPIAPYHEGIIGMTFKELSNSYPAVSGLMTTLVNVVGLTFLSLGVFTLKVGKKAWDEITSWLSILAELIVTLLPLTYVVYAAGGPVSIMVLVDILTIAGLVSSHLES